MFSFLKSDPLKKLKKQHAEKLQEAMNAQRNGDMRLYAKLTAEADKMYQEINKANTSN